MAIFIFVAGALILVALYNKEIDSKKEENSQKGFYLILSLIFLVILLFVIDMLSK
jgi:divalent metal cation (Fe/Co/Zn/Cd) transporter